MGRAVGVFVIAMLVFAGCLPPPPQPIYAVRRSALISHPAPVMRSGAPLDSKVQFQIDNSTVVVPVEPVETEGANAGLFVARHNPGVGLRLRINDSYDVGFRVQTGLLRGAMAITEKPSAPPDGDVIQVGTTWNYSAKLTPKFRLAWAADLLVSANPFDEETRCIRNCRGIGGSSEGGYKLTLITTFSILPSYKTGPVTWFGGLSIRNHPTNTKTDVISQSALMNDDADDLRRGPFYWLAGGGIEVEVGDTVRFLAQIYQPMSDYVARYGPVLGIGVRFDIADKEPPRRLETAR